MSVGGKERVFVFVCFFAHTTTHSPSPPPSTPPHSGDFCIDVGRNIIHGSDAVEAAQREIGLWFPEGLSDFTPHMKPWIYE